MVPLYYRPAVPAQPTNCWPTTFWPQALKEKGTIKEIKPEKSFGKPVKADMPSDIAKYAGYYGVTNQQMKVDIKDGELSITVPMVPDYPAEKYVYTADGTFVSADGKDEGQLRQRKE